MFKGTNQGREGHHIYVVVTGLNLNLIDDPHEPATTQYMVSSTQTAAAW